jgi:hypothetical protein
VLLLEQSELLLLTGKTRGFDFNRLEFKVYFAIIKYIAHWFYASQAISLNTFFREQEYFYGRYEAPYLFFAR